LGKRRRFGRVNLLNLLTLLERPQLPSHPQTLPLATS
jgi:hypothetical protein